MAEPGQTEEAQKFIQRMKDMGIYQSDAPPPAPQPTGVPTVVAPNAPKPMSPSDMLVMDFKKYLASKGMYSGDTSSPEADPQFVSAVRALENMLTSQMRLIDPSSPSLQGLIWQGNKINPGTSVDDIEKSLKIIESAKQKKQASVKRGQATVDTFDVDEYQENPPIAFKPNPTGDDYKIETGDPVETQQTGALQPKLPVNYSVTSPLKDTNHTMDQRILGLSKLLRQLSR